METAILWLLPKHFSNPVAVACDFECIGAANTALERVGLWRTSKMGRGVAN